MGELKIEFEDEEGKMENNVTEMIQEARKLCPVFFPSIFPQIFNPRCVMDIFNNNVNSIEDQQHSIEDSFRLPACFSTEFSFANKEISITQIKVIALILQFKIR